MSERKYALSWLMLLGVLTISVASLTFIEKKKGDYYGTVVKEDRVLGGRVVFSNNKL